jgi:hypothetical protein
MPNTRRSSQAGFRHYSPVTRSGAMSLLDACLIPANDRCPRLPCRRFTGRRPAVHSGRGRALNRGAVDGVIGFRSLLGDGMDRALEDLSIAPRHFAEARSSQRPGGLLTSSYTSPCHPTATGRPPPRSIASAPTWIFGPDGRALPRASNAALGGRRPAARRA